MSLIERREDMFAYAAAFDSGLTIATQQAILSKYGSVALRKTQEYAFSNPTIVTYINEDYDIICSLVDIGFIRAALCVGTQAYETNVIKENGKKYRVVGKLNYPSDVTTRQLNGVQGYTYYGVISSKWQIGNAGTGYENVPSATGVWMDYDITFDLQNNTLSYVVNGVTQTPKSLVYSAPYDLGFFLGSMNNSTLPSRCLIGGSTLYYVNDVLAAHYVPFKRNGNLELLDIMSGTLATRTGSWVEVIQKV